MAFVNDSTTEKTSLTTRGTYGKLNALGTQSGQLARNSYYFRAASIFKRRGLFQFRPYSVFSVFLADAPNRCGRILFSPINKRNLARGSTMHWKILPYEFYTSTENRIVIRQQRTLSQSDAKHVVLDPGQVRVFIDHLQQFMNMCEADCRRKEVEDLLKEIKR